MKPKIFDPKRDIINTLNYKKIFKQPLTFYQLVYFCHTGFRSLKEIEDLLAELLEYHKIRYQKGFYYLSKLKLNVEKVKKKKDEAIKIFSELEKYIFIFENIPFIKFVGVTGTLASYMFDSERDDIDLFIIVEKNRLWISRVILVGCLKLFNLYVNDKNSSLKICPNFYISEDKMSWDETKRNIYVANEIVLMQPFYDKNDYYFQFLKCNSWVKEYIPNFYIPEYESDTLPYKAYTTFLDVCDLLSMFFQKLFMKVRYGSEVLKRDMIHFLKHDNATWILESYDKEKS